MGRDHKPRDDGVEGTAGQAAPERACDLVGLRIGREAKTVERGLEDRLEVAGSAVDRGDGHDHVEDLLGPRTLEHLDTYLAADGVDLSDDVLDRIDQIVPPGVTIKVADNMWNVGTTALDAAFRRR
jgi:hypothetical protein